MYSYSWHIIVPDALSTSSANEEAALRTLCYENWPRNECTNNQLQILEINIIRCEPVAHQCQSLHVHCLCP